MNTESLNLHSAGDTAALLDALRRSAPRSSPHMRVSTYAGGTVLQPILDAPLPKCKALPKELRRRHPFKVRRATKIPPNFEVPPGARWRVVEVLKGACNGTVPDGLFDPDDPEAEGAPILVPEGCSAYAFWLRTRNGAVTFHHGEPTQKGWTLFPFQPDINTYAAADEAFCLLAVVRTGSDKNKWFALDQNVFDNLVTEVRTDSSGVPFGNATKGSLEPGVPARKHIVFKHALPDGEQPEARSVMNPEKNAVERKGFSAPYRRFCPLHPFQLVNFPWRTPKDAPNSEEERKRDWRRVAVATGRVNLPTEVEAVNATMTEHYTPHMSIQRNYRLSHGTDLIARGYGFARIWPTHTPGHPMTVDYFSSENAVLVEEHSRRYFWLESSLVFFRGSTAVPPMEPSHGIDGWWDHLVEPYWPEDFPGLALLPVVRIRSGTLEELKAAWPNYPEQPACDLYMGDRGYGRRTDEQPPNNERWLTAMPTPPLLPKPISSPVARVVIGWVDVGSDDPASPDYHKLAIYQNVRTHLTLDAISGGTKRNRDGHPQREYVWSEPGNFMRIAGFYHYVRRNFCSVKFVLDNSSQTFAAKVYREAAASERFSARYTKRDANGHYVEDTARPKFTTYQTPDRFIKDPWGFNSYYEETETHFRYVAPGGAKYYEADAAWMDWPGIEDAEQWQAAVPPRETPENFFADPGYARQRPEEEGGGNVLTDVTGNPIRPPADYDFAQTKDVQNGFITSPLDAGRAFSHSEFFKQSLTYSAPGDPPLHDFNGGYVWREAGNVFAPLRSNYSPSPPVYGINPDGDTVLVNNGEDFFDQSPSAYGTVWFTRSDRPHPSGVDIRQPRKPDSNEVTFEGDLFRAQ